MEGSDCGGVLAGKFDLLKKTVFLGGKEYAVKMKGGKAEILIYQPG